LWEFVVSSTSRASAVGSGKQSGRVRSQAQVTQREVGKVKKEDKDGSSDGEDPFKALSQVCAVLGTQWGDEGKGKLVEILAQRYDIVARCQRRGDGRYMSEHHGRCTWEHGLMNPFSLFGHWNPRFVRETQMLATQSIMMKV
jgi:hypothetical protein